MLLLLLLLQVIFLYLMDNETSMVVLFSAGGRLLSSSAFDGRDTCIVHLVSDVKCHATACCIAASLGVLAVQAWRIDAVIATARQPWMLGSTRHVIALRCVAPYSASAPVVCPVVC
jgi:hypothetical protein